MSLSKRLREERVRLELTQAEMAQAGGVSLNSQSLYERGVSQPAVSYLVGIRAQGVDLDYLVSGVRQGVDDMLWSEMESALSRLPWPGEMAPRVMAAIYTEALKQRRPSMRWWDASIEAAQVLHERLFGRRMLLQAMQTADMRGEMQKWSEQLAAERLIGKK